MNMKKKKGYTLVELVIVIVILGVLVGVGMVKYGDIQQDAKISADYTTAANIATAANLAKNDGNFNSVLNIENLVNQEYLTSTPKAQSSNEAFSIAISEKGNIIIKLGTNQFYPKVENT